MNVIYCRTCGQELAEGVPCYHGATPYHAPGSLEAMRAALERIARFEVRADRRHRGMVDRSEVETLKRIARAALTGDPGA